MDMRKMLGILSESGWVLHFLRRRPGVMRGSRPRVLVAEDDPVVIEMIHSVLSRLVPGVEIDGTPHGEVAERLIQQEAIYDLVILDIGLADRMNGIEVWRTCADTMPGVPFLFISAVGEAEFRSRIGNCEMLPRFLSKPFPIERLRDEISSALALPKAA